MAKPIKSFHKILAPQKNFSNIRGKAEKGKKRKRMYRIPNPSISMYRIPNPSISMYRIPNPSH